MKAKEFIFEGPWDAVKDAAAKAADTAQQMKTGFDSGYNKMDTILSPSKWGKALSSKDKPEKTSGSSKPSLPDHIIRDVLTKAGSNANLYQDDLQNLKKIQTDLKNGNIKYSDASSAVELINRLLAGKTLGQEQGQTLIALGKQF